MDGPELYHHGILGQKWGVRRYQNYDGTLTVAGKERYRTNKGGRLDEAGKKKMLEDLRRKDSRKELAKDPLLQEKAKSLSQQAKKYREAEREVQKQFEEYDKKSDDEKDAHIRNYIVTEHDPDTIKQYDALVQEALKKGDNKKAKDLMSEKEAFIMDTLKWFKSAWPGMGFEDYLAKEHPEIRKAEVDAWKEFEDASANITKQMVGASDAYKFWQLDYLIRDLALDLNGLTPEWRDSLLAHGETFEKVESFIAHHGILGQKWGVRRYQNDDGTWTIAGKERRRKLRKWDPRRFQNEDGSLTEEGKVRYMDAARRGKLDYRKLSNADLDMINTRFGKENTYKRYVNDALNELPSTKIKKELLKVGEEAVKSAFGAVKGAGDGLGGMFKTAFTIEPEKGGAKGKSSAKSEEMTPEEYARKARLGYMRPGLNQPNDLPEKRGYQKRDTLFAESSSVSSLPDMSYSSFASSLKVRESLVRDRVEKARAWEERQSALKAENMRSNRVKKNAERGMEYLLHPREGIVYKRY